MSKMIKASILNRRRPPAIQLTKKPLLKVLMETQPKKPNRLSVPPSSHVKEIQGFFCCSYPHCNYKSNWEENVGHHEKIHNPTANWNIPCEVCPQNFGFLVSFFYHMSSEHSNKLFCPWCLFLGEDLGHFKAHMLAHIFKLLKSSRHETATCSESIQPKIPDDSQNSIENSKCSEQTDTTEINYHRLSPSPSANPTPEQIQTEEIFCCSSNQNDVEKVTNDQRALFGCDKCHYRTPYASNLRKHSRIHSSEKPFKCPNIGCYYKTRWAQNLQRHQGSCQINIPAKNYQEFAIPAIVDMKKSDGMTETWMDKVKVIEGDEAQFHCRFCSFRSKWKSSIKEHLMVHTACKPFRCPVKGCKYQAKWVQNLRRHSNTVHRNKASKAPLESNLHLGSTRECENIAEDAVDNSSSLVFACMLCDFIGDSEMSALEHARQHKILAISLNRI